MGADKEVHRRSYMHTIKHNSASKKGCVQYALFSLAHMLFSYAQQVPS